MPIIARETMSAPRTDAAERALRGAFLTHLAYLEAFARIATDGDMVMPEAYHALAARLAACPQQPAAPAPIADVPQVRRSLESAWGTELMLLLSRQHFTGDEIVGVSNSWNVVMAYYALYHATQAVLTARGFPRPENHAATQRMFLDNLWGALPETFAPWSLSVGAAGPRPASVVIDRDLRSLWTAMTDRTRWTNACKALETTRADAIPERVANARAEKRAALRRAWIDARMPRLGKTAAEAAAQKRRFPRPRLTAAEKAPARANVRNYTVLDYLYRLRVRGNYQDSAMFTDGPEAPHESDLVRGYLLRIVSASLFVAERVLCTAPDGKRTLDEWARRWCAANVPAGMMLGIAQRVDQWPQR
jgi:hypothetical protein